MVEGARHLVAGEPLAAEFLQAFRVERHAVGQVDAGHDVLRAVGARAADNRDVVNRRVCTQYLFDLTWIDVEAAGDDDFLDTRNQADEAVFFHDAHVAGAEPVVVEGSLGGLRVVEVALEYLVAAGEDLALDAVGLGFVEVVRVCDADLGIRERDAHVTWAAIGAHRVAHDDGGALG